jgi:hypothetical protein
MKEEIALSDNKYFKICIGKRILKKQIFYSKGTVPVYSANVFKPFGFLDKPNGSITDFKRDYVLWGIDGNLEFNVKHKGKLFAVTDHCGAIKILDSSIIPEYLVYQLEIEKYKMGFDRTLRASLANMETITINIPIKADGSFDKETQLELVKKYVFMKEMRLDIQSQIDELSEAMIELDDKSPFKLVEATRIFSFPETNSHVTKRLCQENIGNIPVYGCSQSEESVLGYIKEDVQGIKYYKDSITWNRNGTVGQFFYRQGVFTTNEDQRVMEIKPEFKEQLVPNYLKYILQNEVGKLGYGWTNKLGKTKMIDIKLRIPTNNKGEFDINKQREIAEKYERVYRTKDDIIQHLQSLSKIVVNM